MTCARGSAVLPVVLALVLTISACGSNGGVDIISDGNVDASSIGATSTPPPRRTLPPAPKIGGVASTDDTAEVVAATPTATPTRTTVATPTATAEAAIDPDVPTDEEDSASLAFTDTTPDAEPTVAATEAPTATATAAPAPTAAPDPPPTPRPPPPPTPRPTSTVTSTPEPTPTMVDMVCPTGFDRQNDGTCKGIVAPIIDSYVCPGGFYPEDGGAVTASTVCIDGGGLVAEPEAESFSCPAGSERWLVGDTCVGYADPIPAT